MSSHKQKTRFLKPPKFLHKSLPNHTFTHQYAFVLLYFHLNNLSLIHAFIHLFTDSVVIMLFVHLFSHSLIHSVYSYIHSFIHSLIHASIHWPIHAINHLLMHTYNYWYIHSRQVIRVVPAPAVFRFRAIRIICAIELFQWCFSDICVFVYFQ